MAPIPCDVMHGKHLTLPVYSSVLFIALRCAVIDNFTHHPTLGVKIEGTCIFIPILLSSTLNVRGVKISYDRGMIVVRTLQLDH